jgi:hypothetical protein
MASTEAQLLIFRHQVEEVIEEEPQTPNLKVSASVKFPQSEIFGVKLINGHATQAVLDITNQEPEPVGVAIIGGSLLQDAGDESVVLRNLTAARYQIEIPAGESETITYSFSTEMHPQDVRLQLVAVMKDAKDAFYTISVYNETVSVVEAPTSIFDPQMYVHNHPTLHPGLRAILPIIHIKRFPTRIIDHSILSIIL